MEARIDTVLKRIGLGLAHYADEVELREYIARLEARVIDAEKKWHTEYVRAQGIESRLEALDHTLRGPGKAAYIVFVPDEGETHESD